MIELIVHASHTSGCLNHCGVTSVSGSSIPSGGAVFSQLLRSSSWQGCDLQPLETQLEWTEETDYTVGGFITAVSKWDTQNGLSDTQNGLRHIALLDLYCQLSWPGELVTARLAKAVLGHYSDRKTPRQFWGKRQLLFICRLIYLKGNPFTFSQSLLLR